MTEYNADAVGALVRATAMRGFGVAPSPTRVIFKRGAMGQVVRIAAELGAQRVFIVASRRLQQEAEQVEAGGINVAGRFTDIAMHVPEKLAQDLTRQVLDSGADLLVAIGGGSTIGAAKAVALANGPGYVAIPTTFSGSEVTSIWGRTRDGQKETGRSALVRARAVVYDANLLDSFPTHLAVPGALNAAAHAIEALYAQDASPLTIGAASTGLHLVLGSIHALAEGVISRAVDDTLAGSWLCGVALDSSSMGLHHKLCHVLGGMGLPHAETHAVLLPHTVAYNAAYAPEAMAVVAEVLKCEANSVGAGLHALCKRASGAAGAPATLEAIGFVPAMIAEAVTRVMRANFANPAPLVESTLVDLLERAYHGESPIARAQPLPR